MNPKDTNTFQLVEKLFRNCYKPLRAYACRFVNDTCTAEDVVQDVFCELWTKRESIQFHNTEAVKSYLFKAVYNRSVNALMRKLPDKPSFRDKTETQTVESFMHPYLQNPEQSLLLKELSNEIAGFIETLPLQCKKVFTLSRSSGLKNVEIAGQLGVSVKAVEKHIGKALRELKEHLKKQGLAE
jgi:RNA polymerase sigma-70 factor (ECF subfamily)